MKDQCGRINNRIQAIRELNIDDMALLLALIKFDPKAYPSSITEWVEWLKQESGKNVICL